MTISIRERLDAIERQNQQILQHLATLTAALAEDDEPAEAMDLEGNTTARERDQNEEL